MIDKLADGIENEVNVGNRLERIFNHWTLLFFNVLIVLVVEASSMFFMQTGLVHLIAIFFIVLGASRIFVHYDVYDRFLRPLIHGGILTLLIFSVSHVLEYVSYYVFTYPFESIAANVVNLYLAGLLIIVWSAEYFLKRLEKKTINITPVLFAGIVFCFFLTGLFLFRSELVRLSPSSWQMYAYGTAVLVITILGIRRLTTLQRHVTILVNFINYFNAAVVLIAASALLYVLNDLVEMIGIPFMQVMYISHFLFYGALSLMFLAYVRLSHLGGVYEGLTRSDSPGKEV